MNDLSWRLCVPPPCIVYMQNHHFTPYIHYHHHSSLLLLPPSHLWPFPYPLTLFLTLLLLPILISPLLPSPSLTIPLSFHLLIDDCLQQFRWKRIFRLLHPISPQPALPYCALLSLSGNWTTSGKYRMEGGRDMEGERIQEVGMWGNGREGDRERLRVKGIRFKWMGNWYGPVFVAWYNLPHAHIQDIQCILRKKCMT